MFRGANVGGDQNSGSGAHTETINGSRLGRARKLMVMTAQMEIATSSIALSRIASWRVDPTWLGVQV